MSDDSLYYKHSGAFSISGAATMVVMGVVAGALLGALYGVISFYNPFIYFTFLGALAAGGATGWVVGYGARAGKVRNSVLMVLAGLLAGLVAEYLNLVGWVWAVFEGHPVVLSPLTLLSALQRVAEEGAWSLSSWTPKGFWLYLFWIMEGLIIVGVAAFTAPTVLSDVPFCETCSAWVKDKKVFGPFQVPELPDTLKPKLESGDFSVLEQLEKPKSTPQQWLMVELLYCPSCAERVFLAVTVHAKVVEDKKEKEESSALVSNLIITPEHREKLQAIGRGKPSAGDVAESGEEPQADTSSE